MQSFKKSMPDGICRIGIRQPIGCRPLKKVCLAAFAESEFGSPFSFAESEFGNPGFSLALVFGEEKKLER